MDPFILHHTLLPHSCFPSCGVNHQNRLVLLRPLLPGEILTLDYSTLFTGYSNFLVCSCGCNGCRKKVLGFDMMPVYFQDYYLQNDAVPGEILEVLRRQPDYKIYRIPDQKINAFYWLS